MEDLRVDIGVLEDAKGAVRVSSRKELFEHGLLLLFDFSREDGVEIWPIAGDCERSNCHSGLDPEST